MISEDVLQVHSIAIIFRKEELFHLICGVFSMMVHEADYSISASFVHLMKNSPLYYV